MQDQNYWRKCSVCKSEISFSKTYYECSVSSCSKVRAPVQFCSVSCWDAHNAVLNHKNAGADECQAPSRRRIVQSAPSVISTASAQLAPSSEDEILVVVSKLKAYIKTRSDMSTSADVLEALSNLLRRECDRAILNARQDGRKTVMARDFK